MTEGHMTERVMCADGYHRMRYQAQQDLTCLHCGTSIPQGAYYTKRQGVAIILTNGEPHYERRPFPLCPTCGPFTEITKKEQPA